MPRANRRPACAALYLAALILTYQVLLARCAAQRTGRGRWSPTHVGRKQHGLRQTAALHRRSAGEPERVSTSKGLRPQAVDQITETIPSQTTIIHKVSSSGLPPVSLTQTVDDSETTWASSWESLPTLTQAESDGPSASTAQIDDPASTLAETSTTELPSVSLSTTAVEDTRGPTSTGEASASVTDNPTGSGESEDNIPASSTIIYTKTSVIISTPLPSLPDNSPSPTPTVLPTEGPHGGEHPDIPAETSLRESTTTTSGISTITTPVSASSESDATRHTHISFTTSSDLPPPPVTDAPPTPTHSRSGTAVVTPIGGTPSVTSPSTEPQNTGATSALPTETTAPSGTEATILPTIATNTPGVAAYLSSAEVVPGDQRPVMGAMGTHPLGGIIPGGPARGDGSVPWMSPDGGTGSNGGGIPGISSDISAASNSTTVITGVMVSVFIAAVVVGGLIYRRQTRADQQEFGAKSIDPKHDSDLPPPLAELPSTIFDTPSRKAFMIDTPSSFSSLAVPSEAHTIPGSTLSLASKRTILAATTKEWMSATESVAKSLKQIFIPTGKSRGRNPVPSILLSGVPHHLAPLAWSPPKTRPLLDVDIDTSEFVMLVRSPSTQSSSCFSEFLISEEDSEEARQRGTQIGVRGGLDRLGSWSLDGEGLPTLARNDSVQSDSDASLSSVPSSNESLQRLLSDKRKSTSETHFQIEHRTEDAFVVNAIAPAADV